MLIRVTKEHIRNGKRDMGECPVALALSDAGLVEVDVDVTRFYSEEYKYPEGYENSSKVIRFIQAFDARKPVKPFTFRIRKPKNRGKHG